MNIFKSLVKSIGSDAIDYVKSNVKLVAIMSGVLLVSALIWMMAYSNMNPGGGLIAQIVFLAGVGVVLWRVYARRVSNVEVANLRAYKAEQEAAEVAAREAE